MLCSSNAAFEKIILRSLGQTRAPFRPGDLRTTKRGTLNPPQLAKRSRGRVQIRADPELSKRLMQQLGFDTSGTDSPEAFRPFMEGELERYTVIAKAAGLRKN